MRMNNRLCSLKLFIILMMSLVMAGTARAANPFVGEWQLTIPGGAAGWLGVSDDGGKLSASMLWGFGSVEKIPDVEMAGDALVLSRPRPAQQKDAAGKNVRIINVETITARLDGDKINLTTVQKRPDGTEFGKATFSGTRQPPMPGAPDLSKVKFAEPIQLFNGKDLTGWRLTDPNAVSGWSVQNGLLVNNPAQEPGKPHKNYGNLRTDREFEDFKITLETNLPKGGNSGCYLRGIYEIQVADTFGRPLDPHNMGGLYSRITPTESAEKPAGEWQTMEITFVDRHVTVILNGKKIIDNQPAMGCTGGALWSDVTRPGPIYLQGDHTGVTYRNIVLTPVMR
jgi:hypothetical protein